MFDLGGVLFHYQPQVRWQAFADLTGQTAATVQKQLSDSGYAMSCDSGMLRGERAYREGVRLLGRRLSMARFQQIWISAFTPNVETIAVARALKSKRTPDAGCALALLTNNSDLVKAGLEARWSEVLQLFLPRVFSADLGITKPDPRIFARTLDLMGCAAADTLLVDDAPKNTDTAAALGLQTHLYTNPGNLREDLLHRSLL